MTTHTLLHSPFLTTAEAAQLLRVNEATIRRRCRNGELPALRDGRGWLIDTTGQLRDQPMSQRGARPTTGRLR